MQGLVVSLETLRRDAVGRGGGKGANLSELLAALRNVESAWIKDMNVLIENNEIANMAVTFVLEEGE